MTPDEFGGPTDGFRSYDALGQADRRQLAYVIADGPPGTFRRFTLRDHHDAVARHELDPGVPDYVRLHFDTARNLLLHAWYVYSFSQVAEAHALASLEMALRLCLGVPRGGRMTLRPLMRRALDQGLIRDSGFRRLWRHGIRQEPARAELSNAPWEPPTEAETRYVRMLLDSLPNYRNELAHGSRMLAPGGFVVFGICRDLIDQLFA